MGATPTADAAPFVTLTVGEADPTLPNTRPKTVTMY
jgi:hypothetical protein